MTDIEIAVAVLVVGLVLCVTILALTVLRLRRQVHALKGRIDLVLRMVPGRVDALGPHHD